MTSGRADEDGLREVKNGTVLPADTARRPRAGGVPKSIPKAQRYRDKGSRFSAVLNKHFKTHDLRHSVEDRMKVAGVDAELRAVPMNHTTERPEYGQGGSLEWHRDQLLKIVLPFDPAIV
ncbi:hypothetical protein [Sinorhizobium meliloti]|uniref:hypothetical protein n=1 Tax=Rhizobium meliloti TaxID=382 RepID=UPI000FD894B2|nr:hypothetical protein [Sinorhizobium meliloti]RVG05012.1 hypothetical protein CN231_30640 [Sinorhizobium meliloti]